MYRRYYRRSGYVRPYYRRSTAALSGRGAYSRYRYSRPVYRKRTYVRKTSTVPAIRGKGGYFATKGAKYGAMAGQYAGRILGAAAGSGFESLTGLGAYDPSRIRSNVFLKGDPPAIRNEPALEGATIIRHREYIGDLISASTANTFQVQSFSLNPAQSQTYPWLSQIASQYEEYMPMGVVFEFKSTCSDAIASSTDLALGTVTMATQYDSTNPPFSSLQQMLNYEYAQSGKVSESFLHMIECDPRQSPLTRLYTRPGDVPGNADIRLYDFGTFYISSSGLQGTSINLGQIWISFQYAFFKPRPLISADVSGASFRMYNPTSNGTSWIGSTSTFVYAPENNINVILASNSIQWPASFSTNTYFIALRWAAVGMAYTTAFPTITPNNCVSLNVYQAGAVNPGVAPASGSTSQTCQSLMFYITTNGNGTTPSVVFSGSGSFLTSTLVDLQISEVAYMDPANYD